MISRKKRVHTGQNIRRGRNCSDVGKCRKLFKEQEHDNEGVSIGVPADAMREEAFDVTRLLGPK